MPAVPKVGRGVILSIGNAASTETFAPIGKIENVSIGGLTRQIVQLTTHDVEYIQKLASFRDNGPITFGVAFDSTDTQHALLWTRFLSGAKTNFTLELPDTGAMEFEITAIVSNLSVPDAKSSTLMLNVSLDCESFEEAA